MKTKTLEDRLTSGHSRKPVRAQTAKPYRLTPSEIERLRSDSVRAMEKLMR